MSVPSRNTAVTVESPYLDVERSSVSAGMPPSTRSTGAVTYCSTSSGESADTAVMTCTCTVVTSGTASMGRLRAARIPPTRRAAAPATTSRRLWSARRTMAESTPLFLFVQGGLQDDGLEVVHT